MTKKRTATLFLFVKFCALSLLAAAFLPAHAEYYSTFGQPAGSELCFFCDLPSSKANHKAKSRVKSKPALKVSVKRKAPHAHHSHTGFYVYYPKPLAATCGCNPRWGLPACTGSPAGDSVRFSSQPVDNALYSVSDDLPSFDPDLSTIDDGYPEMEIN